VIPESLEPTYGTRTPGGFTVFLRFRPNRMHVEAMHAGAHGGHGARRRDGMRFPAMHSPAVLAIAFLAVATGIGGCATPATVRRIAAAHPEAVYETIAEGCSWHQRTAGRRFGRDLRAAWLWARQVVGAATTLPCNAAIEAVEAGARRPVYRVARDALGHRTEQVLASP
jgi:hypothetical protein